MSRINSIADIVADPQFQARDMIVAVNDERLDEPLLVPGVVPKLSRTPGGCRRSGRPLGEDTEAVRQPAAAGSRPRAAASTAEPPSRRDADRVR